MPRVHPMLPCAGVVLVIGGLLAVSAVSPAGSATTATPVAVILTPTPIEVPYAVGSQTGTYTVQPDPVTTSVDPVTETATVTDTVTVTAAPAAGYTPYTPSAVLKPGRDYQVGVEPFLASGVTLTTVTPNMSIPGVPGLKSDAQGNINVTSTFAGAKLSRLRLPTGYINVAAANVTISQSLVEGFNNTNLTANKGLINATNQSAMGLVVQDTTLALRSSYVATPWDGIKGHDFTALRVKVRYTTDGFGIFNANSGHTSDPVHVSIIGSDVDQLTYTSPDPNHSSDSPISHSHNDAIQIQGAASGSSIQVKYSTLNGESSSRGQIGYSSTSPDPSNGGYNVHYPYTEAMSALMITPNVTNVTGLDVHDNWLDGGAYTINIRDTINYNIGQFVNNRFGHDTRPDLTPPYQITMGKAALTAGTVVSGNVFDDTGGPIAVHAY